MGLDNNPRAVVALVLDDLRHKAREAARALVPSVVEIGDADAAVARAGARAFKRETGLLGLVLVVLLDNAGVEHYERVGALSYSDDAFALADHVRGESHALMGVGGKRVGEVALDADVFRRGRRARHAQHDGRVDDVANHGFPLWIDRGWLRVSVALCAAGREVHVRTGGYNEAESPRLCPSRTFVRSVQ